MGKSKKSGKGVVYRSAVDIAPCPFCKSDNIILATDFDPDTVGPMKVVCLGCRTVFTFDMACSMDNVTNALRFWNNRG